MGYLNLINSFKYKEPLFRSKLAALANNDAQLKTDGWAQNTKTLFFQAAVPAGWTQDVSQNDKALRVVGPIGGGGAGGVTPLSTTISLAHAHVVATPSDGGHTHDFSSHSHLAGPRTTLNPYFTFGSGAPDGLVVSNVGGFLFTGSEFHPIGGNQPGSTVTKLKGFLDSPGAVVLSTLANHNHGALPSNLTDVALAYCDVIVGTKNAPGGTYTDLTTFWHTGDKADFDPFAAYAANDAYNLAAIMPAATVMLFGQAAAPSGWTKVVGVDDRMLRVVSGAGGGAGGAQITSAGVTLGHTHVLPMVADHVHTFPDHSHVFATDGTTQLQGDTSHGPFAYVVEKPGTGGVLAVCAFVGGYDPSSQSVYKASATSSGGGSTAAAGGHSHALPNALTDLQLAYVDVIQCSKDAAGEPAPYTDYTAEFAWKKLVSRQRLNTLAGNDACIQYHTTPSGTQAFFFMASPPVGWIKNTAQHDKALRVVSGGSGGAPGGGSQLMSSVIPLAHTHTVTADGGHTHLATHVHPLDTGPQSIIYVNNTSYPFVSNIGDALGDWVGEIRSLNLQGGGTPGNTINKTSQPPVELPANAGSHAHGGVTDSKLTDVALAYADVIWCTKA